MRLTDSEKNALKKPLGKLLPNEKISRRKIVSFLGNCEFIVSVGDDTTCTLLSFGITPTISITDGKTMRRAIALTQESRYDFLRSYLHNEQVPEFRCKNPAGSIGKDAYNLVARLIQKKIKAKIIIDGEEDLLAIPMFAFLPKNSVLAYGQPKEGLVLVRINSVIQNMAKDLLTRFDLEV